MRKRDNCLHSFPTDFTRHCPPAQVIIEFHLYNEIFKGKCYDRGPFHKIITDGQTNRPTTDRPTNQQTNMRVDREVTLPITSLK